MAVIETANLKKYYGKSRGIEDVTLAVEPGEIFGFIGPNGAGKSTTIRILLNLIFPTAGTAKVLGLDVVRDSLKVRAQVGYLPAEVGYYEDMTVRQLLEYSSGFHGMDDAAMRARIGELATAFELDTTRNARALSTGNRRKVGICLALLHSPKVLIMDEPTAGLDPLMQRRLFEVLAAENTRGVTVFFSSHVLSEVQRFCHRVAIIKDGHVLRIDEMSKLRTELFLKVRATFAPGATPVALAIPGVIHEHLEGNALEMLFKGDINVLIQHLGKHHLASLALEEPALEEIFMRYYEREGEGA